MPVCLRETIIGEQAHVVARRKATHSDYAWLCWEDRDGARKAMRVTRRNVKAALLETGTQGFIVLYPARGGFPTLVRWREGVMLLSNLASWQRHPATRPHGFALDGDGTP